MSLRTIIKYLGREIHPISTLNNKMLSIIGDCVRETLFGQAVFALHAPALYL